MKHLGAWHEEDDERFQNGPLAKPETYSARLTVGDSISEQSFNLVMDPRVLDQGTSVADVNAQVDLSLQLVELLSEARRLEKQLTDEQEELEGEGDTRSEVEQQRLDQLNGVLERLKTADIVYPQPMVTGQIEYLFNMINTADQAPGKEAEDRFEVLTTQLLDITALAAE